MSTRSFVEACKRERESLLAAFTDRDGGRSAAPRSLDLARLSDEQRAHVVAAIGIAVTDTLYTMLLGLGGAASLGGEQQRFRLFDQAGQLVSEDQDGDLESIALRRLSRRRRRMTRGSPVL